MDMSKYKGMFLSESSEHIADMNRLVMAIEKEPDNRENIDSLFRAAHSVKGSAAAMGYREITELSHKMEDLMDKVRRRQLGFNHDIADLLLESIDILEKLLTAVAQDRSPDIGIGNIVERLTNYQVNSSSGHETEESGVPKKDMQSSVNAFSGMAGSPPKIPLTEAINGNIYDISVRISPESQVPSVRAYIIFRKLKDAGRILSSSPSELELKERKFSNMLTVRLDSRMAEEDLQQVIISAGEVYSVDIRSVSLQTDDPSLKDSDVSRKDAAGPRMQGGKEHELSSVVKINTTLLDSFVNAVGDLLINKSRLHEISKGIPSRELKEGIGQLDRLIRDLQNQVMKVRLMPIETVTERLSRTARDIARKLGKEIEFISEGQDIELDRSILEVIGNPLVHIIRNSIDHGVEMPDERRSQGKVLPAVVAVRATREKDQVLLEISDDGRGMDAHAIKMEALKKGLITEEKASEMSNQEALFLTCLPGFSTAREVSELSGRGVGLDAVKSAVESLGGGMEMDSAPGTGTRIILKLPLTVAIIQTLLVEVSSQIFALPVSRVIRTLEIDKDEIKKSQKHSLILFEGSLIPLLSLSKMLDIPPSPAKEGFISAIITEIKGRIVGLVVDRIVGHQEAFIKPLSRPLNRMSGLSGTTVLGNGKTIFLLDIGNLS